jgi:hypothetical protein
MDVEDRDGLEGKSDCHLEPAGWQCCGGRAEKSRLNITNTGSVVHMIRKIETIKI